jgi:hypothetical protein
MVSGECCNDVAIVCRTASEEEEDIRVRIWQLVPSKRYR